MARIARVVVPGLPHHVTQRGNRRQRTFFSQADYAAYRALLATWCREHDVVVWAYCLMPNHVHLILVPGREDGLRRALGEAHRRYTRSVNARRGRVGHLWQGRFASFPLDGGHLVAAARCVELNPVRAGLAARAEAWPWSSARAHLAGRDDGLVSVAPLLDAVGDWRAFLDGGTPGEDALALLRTHERTGRPLGDAGFVAQLEQRLGRRLRPGKRGPRASTRREHG
jgi:putative transposase